jgi:hypothetical protein
MPLGGLGKVDSQRGGSPSILHSAGKHFVITLFELH